MKLATHDPDRISNRQWLNTRYQYLKSRKSRRQRTNGGRELWSFDHACNGIRHKQHSDKKGKDDWRREAWDERRNRERSGKRPDLERGHAEKNLSRCKLQGERALLGLKKNSRLKYISVEVQKGNEHRLTSHSSASRILPYKSASRILSYKQIWQ